jgi:hypothetical protein
MADYHRWTFLSLLFEFILVITGLGLFLGGYIENVRSSLWEIGGNHGWNSNPRLRIYFYANHITPPDVPLVWSQRYTCW